MAKIKKLSPLEAQKIAAGEVVERPANVVKELVENALDAGATSITVYTEDGGLQVIRVIDNGCGMAPDDARTCFEHHATSKINAIDDLAHLTTFGFRGEALSSIVAVSKVTLITKEAQAVHATRIDAEANVIGEATAVAANTGTDITVRDLFFNVPARRKFLKNGEAQARAIDQVLQAFCLQHIHIQFKIYVDNELQYHCMPALTLQERAAQVWESSVAQALIEVKPQLQQGIRVRGLISDNHYTRYDRLLMLFFVNGRRIKNHALGKALIKGYGNNIPPARYPASIILIDINSAEVDVNVHPRKDEVQFLNPRRVELLITNAVVQALTDHVALPLRPAKAAMADLPTFAPSTTLHRDNEEGTFNRRSAAVVQNLIRQHQAMLHGAHRTEFSVTLSAAPHVDEVSVSTTTLDVQQMMLPPMPFLDDTPEEKSLNDDTYRLIGQYNNTYLLVDTREGLLVVDQHAAHERILYERFGERFDASAAVNLVVPISVELPAASYATIAGHIGLLQQYGIGIEPFGQRQFVIRSTPVYLKHCSFLELLQELAAAIDEDAGLEPVDVERRLHEHLRAQMACKAAVKAGDVLGAEQLNALLNDLSTIPNRFSCPHGRPTTWLLTLSDLEKKFRRKA
jgi:DNA mismatch repair protein MutL